MNRLLTLGVAIFVLAGCAVGPNYQRPTVETPATFRFSDSTAPAGNQSLEWWDVYGDVKLQALIRQAFEGNLDLKIAVSRVEEARAVASVARSVTMPSVTYGGNVSRGKNDLFDAPYPDSAAIVNSGVGTMSALWELDLWGRVRRLNEAAEAQLLASEAGKNGVRLSLLSDVASAYFELLELDEEVAVNERAAASFQESLRIFGHRVEGGTASSLETARARADWDQAVAAIPGVRVRIAQIEDQLGVLLGVNPGPITRNSLADDISHLPRIPAGVPSELLERRPDIRQAEEQLHSANAAIGESLAEFFPKIGLTAILGKVSPQLSDFTHAGATTWGVGAEAAGPIFDGGRTLGQYHGAKALRSEAESEYRKTVLNSFREVSDALIARDRLEEVRAREEDQVEALKEAVKLSLDRYNAGKADYYEVLESQQLLFPAQLALARTQRDELLAVVAIYKAMGGGWKE